jgi:hypothetical protein
MVSEWLKNALDEAGITDYDEAVIDAAGKALATLMLDLVVSHPNYFSTAVMNLECIASAHFPELCYSWLVSMDANYTAEPEITEPETTTPDTTEPEVIVPETTIPETTVPETTVPETTVPETTVPETTVPETTVPETTVPETTVPETTVPETTVPETTVPETTVPETTVPETTVPEVTEPVEPEVDHFEFAQNADTSNVKLNESAGTITFSSGSVSSDDVYTLFANDDVTVKDAKGNVVSDGKIGTGYTVTSTVNGVSETIEVVVIGDVNGDGNVASADVLSLTTSLISGKKLSGAYAAAADSNGDGAVTSTDILHLSSKVRGW